MLIDQQSQLDDQSQQLEEQQQLIATLRGQAEDEIAAGRDTIAEQSQQIEDQRRAMVSMQTMTWIVRFGEAPGYALVAGRPREDGSRPVYHSADPVLVEHLTFRLRAEAGFGLRG